MKKPGAESADEPWGADFEAVSLAQQLRFRALSPREKIQALQDMAELVERMHAQRRAQGLPVLEPESKRRK